jgi:multidrug efflux pump subunit AcrB
MGSTQLLSNLVTVQRGSYAPVIVNHYNVWPVFDVYANVDRRDLGGVGAEVEKIMREEEPICRAALRSRCAGRSKPCNRRSSAWGWAWSSPWFWSICS